LASDGSGHRFYASVLRHISLCAAAYMHSVFLAEATLLIIQCYNHPGRCNRQDQVY